MMIIISPKGDEWYWEWCLQCKRRNTWTASCLHNYIGRGFARGWQAYGRHMGWLQ